MCIEGSEEKSRTTATAHKEGAALDHKPHKAAAERRRGGSRTECAVGRAAHTSAPLPSGPAEEPEPEDSYRYPQSRSRASQEEFSP